MAHGDLAQNGHLQLLIVDRASNAENSAPNSSSQSPMLVTRAAIVERDGDKWVKLLRCDEHLANPNGYLQGTPINPVTGWKLKFEFTGRRGLNMLFTPVNGPSRQDQASNGAESGSRPVEVPVDVQWNKKVKRYQSLDAAGNVFLDETQALEIQHSVLK